MSERIEETPVEYGRRYRAEAKAGLRTPRTIAEIKGPPIRCDHCGKEFHRTPALRAGNRNQRGKHNYCSRTCMTEAYKGRNLGETHVNYVPPLTLTCEQCGGQFTRKPWQTRGDHKARFCSVACRSAFRSLHLSGANAPDYVGGPKTYRGRGWLKARQAVVDEQRGCCAKCGKHIGQSLPVHHKRPFREFASVEEANARANLEGLCQPCHMHSEYRPYRR